MDDSLQWKVQLPNAKEMHIELTLYVKLNGYRDNPICKVYAN